MPLIIEGGGRVALSKNIIKIHLSFFKSWIRIFWLYLHFISTARRVSRTRTRKASPKRVKVKPVPVVKAPAVKAPKSHWRDRGRIRGIALLLLT